MARNSRPAPAPRDDVHKAGDIISDRYRLLRKAGEGAMGAVWVAENTSLGSKIALKLIRPEMRLPMIVERMLREARAAARLSHSSIVRVFDLGETAAGDPYIVMEFLDGESLGSVLDRESQVSAERALNYILPIVSAMEAAHENGVIHRDLKPENIMLTVDGEKILPKIVDFGIVKLQSSEGDDGAATGSILLGTPEYMSPEQAGGGGEVDPRSDIWSLCTVLYECLAGTTPFRGGNTFQILHDVVHEQVPSLEERGLTDASLWTIIDRGLKKNRDERWQSMRALREALEGWLSAQAIHESTLTAEPTQVRPLPKIAPVAKPPRSAPLPAARTTSPVLSDVSEAAAIAPAPVSIPGRLTRLSGPVGMIAALAAVAAAAIWALAPKMESSTSPVPAAPVVAYVATVDAGSQGAAPLEPAPTAAPSPLATGDTLPSAAPAQAPLSAQVDASAHPTATIVRAPVRLAGLHGAGDPAQGRVSSTAGAADSTTAGPLQADAGASASTDAGNPFDAGAPFDAGNPLSDGGQNPLNGSDEGLLRRTEQRVRTILNAPQ